MKLLSKIQTEFTESVALREAASEDAIDETAPQIVASPRDAEAAQKLVAWCGREDVAFIARGGATKIGVGAKPSRCDLIISTEHLNAIIEHDVGNATVAAGAGVALSKLNEVVMKSGQFVPLDDAFSGEAVLHAGATLGGAVAANDFGQSRLKYGAPRDLVVGLHAALSDGRYIKAGSKVVKNVSGYDLNKLFIGSFGTLGLITQVIIRLRPQDACNRRWSSTPADWKQACEAVETIMNGAFEPTYLRLMAANGKFYLAARFDGGEEAVNSQIERLDKSTSSETDEVTDGELVLRARLPLQSAARWAKSASEKGAAEVLWDCGIGAVRAVFSKTPDDAAKLVDVLRREAQADGGFLVVEKAPANLKTPDWVWGAPRDDFALMRRLKDSFDKPNVCAPGRFVGGL